MSAKAVGIACAIIVSLLVIAIFGISLTVLIKVLNGTFNTINPSTPPVEERTTKITASSTVSSTTLASSTPSATTTTSTTSTTSVTPPSPSFKRSAPVISRDDPRYDSFKRVATLFGNDINTTVNPCKDFYTFVCGTMPSKIAFMDATRRNSMLIHNKVNNETYRKAVTSTALKKLFVEYDKCVHSDFKWNKTYFRRQFDDFQMQTGLEFPFRTQKPLARAITAENLAKAIGFISSRRSIQTLLSVWVDTNWRAPQSKWSYLLYIDQSSLLAGLNFYKKRWNTGRAALIQEFINRLGKIVTGLDIKNVHSDKISATATELADFEHTLATTILTDEDERRKYERSYNVFTVEMADKILPPFKWRDYFEQISRRIPNVQRKLLSPDFRFIIKEPEVISNLLNKIYDETFSNELIANYLYVRFSQPFLKYVPDNANNPFTAYDALKEAMLSREKDSFLATTIWKQNIPPENLFPSFFCGMVTAFTLPYANGRVFIDAYLKNTTAREHFRMHVAGYVSSVIDGFRGQINGLTWMSSETKKEAYDKISNFVKNIGYPDFLVNDTLLDAYYADLDIDMDGGQTFAEREEARHQFNMKKSWNRLLVTTGSKRDNFAGSPSIVNAWYQPQVNSLTLPLGILVEPFYSPTYPAAVNFGTLGVIAGHELTHGFDDQGIQWNGIGRLSKWMDNSSLASFNEMAQCVIDEYSGFCPLERQYQRDGCINGRQTQGENIADNGGIRAAYRGYKHYVGINGPDPRLDHPILKALNGDQLFFMSFAHTWCDSPPSDEELFFQLLFDPHSPSLYRVWGTIQNFPEFRQAFNCPVGDAYTPRDHCKVWDTSVSQAYGIPSPPRNAINEGLKPQVDPTDITMYKAYTEAATLIETSLDLSKDPCNSFYEYACGNYEKPLSFVYGRDRNYMEQAKQMSDPKYRRDDAPEALKKAIMFFDKCIEIQPKYEAAIADGKIVKDAMSDFAKKTTFKFNMFVHQHDKKEVPDLKPATLAKALAELSSKGVDTLLSMFIDTDWEHPENGYLIYLDQSTLYYPKTYYKPNAWKTVAANHLNNTIQWFMDYAAVEGKELEEDQLKADIEKLFALEIELALQYSTDGTQRRKFKRSYNVKTIAEASLNMTFIDLKEYFDTYAGDNAQLKDLFDEANYKFSVMEPMMIKKLSDAVEKYTDDQKIVLVDYLFYRLLMSKVDFLPRRKARRILETLNDSPRIGRPKRGERFPLEDFDRSDPDAVKQHCAYLSLVYLPEANARFFIDYLYPQQKDRDSIRSKTKAIINDIRNAFDSMIDQVDWMDRTTKLGAYGKISDVQINVAYPDFVMNNTALDDYFKELTFADEETYFGMLDKMEAFTFNKINSQLFEKTYNRGDFGGPAGTMNAWYMPGMNSITFPAGILRQPFFDENWPTSMNYGALGLVAGHELVHGFDDQGIQWNGQGKLDVWMSQESQKSFHDMAKCVIDEYNKFCPLEDTAYKPSCVDGAQTQGENIADNGGIRAAFSAYRNHISLNGPEPQLPGQLMSQFSHDQLFFLNFAQVWCQKPYTQKKLYKQLLVDSHSPSKYRVFGTIQNFPEFRAAFNCPAGSEYGPEPGKFCPVWVPKT